MGSITNGAIILFSVISLTQLTHADAINMGSYNISIQLKQEIQEVWNLAGIEVEWIELPAERSLREAARGQLAGDILRTPEAIKPYPNLKLIPTPAATRQLFIYVTEDSHCISLKAMSNHHPVGINGFKYFLKIYSQSESGYSEVRKPQDLLLMLITKRGDFTVLPSTIAKDLNAKNKTQLVSCETYATINLHTVLHRQHWHLIPKLDKAYQQFLR